MYGEALNEAQLVGARKCFYAAYGSLAHAIFILLSLLNKSGKITLIQAQESAWLCSVWKYVCHHYSGHIYEAKHGLQKA